MSDERSATERGGGIGRVRAVVDRAATAVTRYRSRVVTAVFGDRVGLALFLGALVYVSVHWRVGLFITDDALVADTLLAVADGHLSIERFVYGSVETPGVRVSDGTFYGRNYGQVVLALPVLWAVWAIATVADLAVAIAALWSLLLLALALQVGRVVGREQSAAVLGSLTAVVVFAANLLAGPVPIESRWQPQIALQVSTMLAAGLAVVVAYRLLVRLYGRRIAIAAGAGVLFATPFAFWASVTKRHVIVALLVFCAVYALHRSRESSPEPARLFRGAAYAAVGVCAWVSPPEALPFGAALLLVDLPTARSNDLRTLATIVAIGALSLVPFLATNLLVTGSPIRPPFALPGAGTSTGPSGPPPIWARTGRIDPLEGAPAEALLRLIAGATLAFLVPGRLYHTFLRSGYTAEFTLGDGGEAISLSVLEAAPVLAALVAVPLLVVRDPTRYWNDRWADRATRTIDGFAVVYAVVLVLFYLPNLPSMAAQVTVRYLLPVYPLGIYGALRLRAVRRIVRTRSRLIAGSYAAGVLLGCQLLLAAVVVGRASRGEAIQLHALAGLVVVSGVALWAIPAGIGRSDDRLGAISLGLAAAATTDFVVLASLRYFADTGTHALPVVRVVSALVTG